MRDDAGSFTKSENEWTQKNVEEASNDDVDYSRLNDDHNEAYSDLSYSDSIQRRKRRIASPIGGSETKEISDALVEMMSKRHPNKHPVTESEETMDEMISLIESPQFTSTTTDNTPIFFHMNNEEDVSDILEVEKELDFTLAPEREAPTTSFLLTEIPQISLRPPSFITELGDLLGSAFPENTTENVGKDTESSYEEYTCEDEEQVGTSQKVSNESHISKAKALVTTKKCEYQECDVESTSSEEESEYVTSGNFLTEQPEEETAKPKIIPEKFEGNNSDYYVDIDLPFYTDDPADHHDPCAKKSGTSSKKIVERSDGNRQIWKEFKWPEHKKYGSSKTKAGTTQKNEGGDVGKTTDRNTGNRQIWKEFKWPEHRKYGRTSTEAKTEESTSLSSPKSGGGGDRQIWKEFKWPEHRKYGSDKNKLSGTTQKAIEAISEGAEISEGGKAGDRQIWKEFKWPEHRKYQRTSTESLEETEEEIPSEESTPTSSTGKEGDGDRQIWREFKWPEHRKYKQTSTESSEETEEEIPSEESKPKSSTDKNRGGNRQIWKEFKWPEHRKYKQTSTESSEETEEEIPSEESKPKSSTDKNRGGNRQIWKEFKWPEHRKYKQTSTESLEETEEETLSEESTPISSTGKKAGGDRQIWREFKWPEHRKYHGSSFKSHTPEQKEGTEEADTEEPFQSSTYSNEFEDQFSKKMKEDSEFEKYYSTEKSFQSSLGPHVMETGFWEDLHLPFHKSAHLKMVSRKPGKNVKEPERLQWPEHRKYSTESSVPLMQTAIWNKMHLPFHKTGHFQVIGESTEANESEESKVGPQQSESVTTEAPGAMETAHWDKFHSPKHKTSHMEAENVSEDSEVNTESFEVQATEPVEYLLENLKKGEHTTKIIEKSFSPEELKSKTYILEESDVRTTTDDWEALQWPPPRTPNKEENSTESETTTESILPSVDAGIENTSSTRKLEDQIEELLEHSVDTEEKPVPPIPPPEDYNDYSLLSNDKYLSDALHSSPKFDYVEKQIPGSYTDYPIEEFDNTLSFWNQMKKTHRTSKTTREDYPTKPSPSTTESTTVGELIEQAENIHFKKQTHRPTTKEFLHGPYKVPPGGTLPTPVKESEDDDDNLWNFRVINEDEAATFHPKTKKPTQKRTTIYSFNPIPTTSDDWEIFNDLPKEENTKTTSVSTEENKRTTFLISMTTPENSKDIMENLEATEEDLNVQTTSIPSIATKISSEYYDEAEEEVTGEEVYEWTKEPTKVTDENGIDSLKLEQATFRKSGFYGENASPAPFKNEDYGRIWLKKIGNDADIIGGYEDILPMPTMSDLGADFMREQSPFGRNRDPLSVLERPLLEYSANERKELSKTAFTEDNVESLATAMAEPRVGESGDEDALKKTKELLERLEGPSALQKLKKKLLNLRPKPVGLAVEVGTNTPSYLHRLEYTYPEAVEAVIAVEKTTSISKEHHISIVSEQKTHIPSTEMYHGQKDKFKELLDLASQLENAQSTKTSLEEFSSTVPSSTSFEKTEINEHKTEFVSTEGESLISSSPHELSESTHTTRKGVELSSELEEHNIQTEETSELHMASTSHHHALSTKIHDLEGEKTSSIMGNHGKYETPESTVEGENIPKASTGGVVDMLSTLKQSEVSSEAYSQPEEYKHQPSSNIPMNEPKTEKPFQGSESTNEKNFSDEFAREHTTTVQTQELHHQTISGEESSVISNSKSQPHEQVSHQSSTLSSGTTGSHLKTKIDNKKVIENMQEGSEGIEMNLAHFPEHETSTICEICDGHGEIGRVTNPDKNAVTSAEKKSQKLHLEHGSSEELEEFEANLVHMPKGTHETSTICEICDEASSEHFHHRGKSGGTTKYSKEGKDESSTPESEVTHKNHEEQQQEEFEGNMNHLPQHETSTICEICEGKESVSNTETGEKEISGTHAKVEGSTKSGIPENFDREKENEEQNKKTTTRQQANEHVMEGEGEEEENPKEISSTHAQGFTKSAVPENFDLEQENEGQNKKTTKANEQVLEGEEEENLKGISGTHAQGFTKSAVLENFDLDKENESQNKKTTKGNEQVMEGGEEENPKGISGTHAQGFTKAAVPENFDLDKENEGQNKKTTKGNEQVMEGEEEENPKGISGTHAQGFTKSAVPEKFYLEKENEGQNMKTTKANEQFMEGEEEENPPTSVSGVETTGLTYNFKGQLVEHPMLTTNKNVFKMGQPITTESEFPVEEQSSKIDEALKAAKHIEQKLKELLKIEENTKRSEFESTHEKLHGSNDEMSSEKSVEGNGLEETSTNMEDLAEESTVTNFYTEYRSENPPQAQSDMASSESSEEHEGQAEGQKTTNMEEESSENMKYTDEEISGSPESEAEISGSEKTHYSSNPKETSSKEHILATERFSPTAEGTSSEEKAGGEIEELTKELVHHRATELSMQVENKLEELDEVVKHLLVTTPETEILGDQTTEDFVLEDAIENLKKEIGEMLETTLSAEDILRELDEKSDVLSEDSFGSYPPKYHGKEQQTSERGKVHPGVEEIKTEENTPAHNGKTGEMATESEKKHQPTGKTEEGASSIDHENPPTQTPSGFSSALEAGEEFQTNFYTDVNSKTTTKELKEIDSESPEASSGSSHFEGSMNPTESHGRVDEGEKAKSEESETESVASEISTPSLYVNEKTHGEAESELERELENLHHDFEEMLKTTASSQELLGEEDLLRDIDVTHELEETTLFSDLSEEVAGGKTGGPGALSDKVDEELEELNGIVGEFMHTSPVHVIEQGSTTESLDKVQTEVDKEIEDLKKKFDEIFRSTSSVEEVSEGTEAFEHEKIGSTSEETPINHPVEESSAGTIGKEQASESGISMSPDSTKETEGETNFYTNVATAEEHMGASSSLTENIAEGISTERPSGDHITEGLLTEIPSKKGEITTNRIEQKEHELDAVVNQILSTTPSKEAISGGEEEENIAGEVLDRELEDLKQEFELMLSTTVDPDNLMEAIEDALSLTTETSVEEGSTKSHSPSGEDITEEGRESVETSTETGKNEENNITKENLGESGDMSTSSKNVGESPEEKTESQEHIEKQFSTGQESFSATEEGTESINESTTNETSHGEVTGAEGSQGKDTNITGEKEGTTSEFEPHEAENKEKTKSEEFTNTGASGDTSSTEATTSEVGSSEEENKEHVGTTASEIPAGDTSTPEGSAETTSEIESSEGGNKDHVVATGGTSTSAPGGPAGDTSIPEGSVEATSEIESSGKGNKEHVESTDFTSTSASDSSATEGVSGSISYSTPHAEKSGSSTETSTSKSHTGERFSSVSLLTTLLLSLVTSTTQAPGNGYTGVANVSQHQNLPKCLVVFITGESPLLPINGSKWVPSECPASGQQSTAPTLTKESPNTVSEAPGSTSTTEILTTLIPVEELPEIRTKNFVEGGCTEQDFENNNKCFCMIDSTVDSVAEKLEGGNSSKTYNIKCSKFLKVNKGLVMRNETLGALKRSRRSYLYLRYLNRQKREIVDYNKIDEVLANELTVGSTDKIVYSPVGVTATIPCFYKDEVVERENFMKYVWSSDDDKTIVFSDRIRETTDGALKISDVTIEDGGNYTCSVNRPFGNTETEHKRFKHELLIIKWPIFKVKSNVMYLTDEECSLKDGDVVHAYLPKMLEDLLCGLHKRVCNVEMERPSCVEVEGKTYLSIRYIVTLAGISHLIPSISSSECDYNCQMKVTGSLVSLLVKNVETTSVLDVISEVSSFNHTFKPREVKFSADRSLVQDTSLLPKLLIGCPAGFGFQSTAKICGACPRNTYNNENSSVCSPCPNIQYQPKIGSASCIECKTPFDDKACVGMMFANKAFLVVYIGSSVAVVFFILLCIFCAQTSTQAAFSGPQRRKKQTPKRKRIGRKDVEDPAEKPLLPKDPTVPKIVKGPKVPPPDF